MLETNSRGDPLIIGNGTAPSLLTYAQAAGSDCGFDANRFGVGISPTAPS
jgi:hypothetical protein